MTALPDVSGVRHPATWPLYPHRWFGRFVIRCRLAVVEHGAVHDSSTGPVILAANDMGVAYGPLSGLFGPRPVHVLTNDDLFQGRMGTFLSGKPARSRLGRLGGRASRPAKRGGAP